MSPDRYKERGGRLPHVIHRWKVEDQNWAKFEEDGQLTPIPPVILPKINTVVPKPVKKETGSQPEES